MENNLEVIPIFFAVDDVYSPFLAVTLQSLIENASKNYYYSIKILYTLTKSIILSSVTVLPFLSLIILITGLSWNSLFCDNTTAVSP